MKLFTPKQAKEESKVKHDDQIHQIAYLTNTLKKLQDRINIEQKNFDDRMKEQRALYHSEKERLQGEVKGIEARIVEKERKLIELLLPEKDYLDRAQETLSRTQMQALSLITREENIAGLENLLMEKLDTVSEREQKAIDLDLKLRAKSKGIEEESAIVAKWHKILNEDKTRFEQEKTTKVKFLEERENAILLKEKRNQEFLELRTKELNELERGLKDRRQALDRAFEEIKRLKQ